MKRFNLFTAVIALSAVAGVLYSDRTAAMPITLAFEATIIEPLTVSDERVYVSGGGIFAPGQAVTGSIQYDPDSLSLTLDSLGRLLYFGVVPSASFSISAVGGPYKATFPDGGFVFACQGLFAACNTLGWGDTYALLGGIRVSVPNPPPIQPVNGLGLNSYTLAFLGDDILISNALLNSAELISLTDRAPEILFSLSFRGETTCEGQICIDDFASVQGRITKIAVVPEPATIGLVLVGAALTVRRRKARR